MALSDKQKAERAMALGSSDAPIVAGVSSYCSPLELYYKLHGELPRYDNEETEAQEWGHRLEEVIAQAFADKTGTKIRRIGGRTHPQHPGLVAHVDRQIVGSVRGPGVLECKARDRSQMPVWEAGGVPDDVRLQVIHQLAVTNCSWACVAVLFEGKQFRTYEIERDKELEEYLLEIELRFLARVQRSEPPTEAWTPENIGILRKLYPTDSGKTIELADNHSINVEGFIAAKKELEAAEEKKALYEGLIKEAMTDASKAVVPGYNVSWKSTKARQSFDEDRFATENPDLYAKYMKTVPGYRRFLVTPQKGLVKI